MNNDDIRQLVESMSSFYQENLPLDSAYENLLNAYLQSFLALWQEATYLRENVLLEESPTLHTLPYAEIDISKARYDQSFARKLSQLSTLEEVIQELDEKGNYAEFTFTQGGVRTPIVYSMDLKVVFEEEGTLEIYEDYFIRTNRLYLLPPLLLRTDKQYDILHAFNIKVDNYMIEQKWGTYFGVETGPLLPRYQYRDIISAFRRLLMSDLSIKQMKESVRLATGWEEFDILDKFSPQLHPNVKLLYDRWYLSPAQFIVSLPEELISEKMQLNVLLSLMDEAKESQIHYLVLFGIIRKDTWKGDDKHQATVHMGLREINKADDTIAHTVFYRREDSLFPLNRYDVGRHYDFKLKYDAEDDSHLVPEMDAGEYVMFDDPQLSLDTPWSYRNEWYRVTHVEFPEIPRGSVLTKNSDELIMTVNSNTDGTTHYELLASTEEYGRYNVVERIENDDTIPTNSIIHNAGASGMRYYKVRAVAGEDTSLATIAVDSSTL